VDADAIPVPQIIKLCRLVVGRTTTDAGTPTLAVRRSRETAVPPVFSYPMGRQDYLVWTSPHLPVPKETTIDDLIGVRGRSQGGVRLSRPSGRMLDEFLELADASAKRILSYAQRWGVLGICRHGKPCTHTPYTSQRIIYPPVPDLCAPLGWDGRGGREPVEAWRRYAREATAILRVGESLRDRRTPTESDLRTLLAPHKHPSRVPVSIAWPLLIRAVNRWVTDGDVRPWLVLHAHTLGYEPRVRMASPWSYGTPSWGLFGALGTQIQLAIARASYMFCDECGRKCDRRRSPAAGREHFCSPTCAARKRQRRHREAKWLQVAGSTRG
jgi:hypothetical protein